MSSQYGVDAYTSGDQEPNTNSVPSNTYGYQPQADMTQSQTPQQPTIALQQIGDGPSMLLTWNAPGASSVTIWPGVGPASDSGSMAVYPQSQDQSYMMIVSEDGAINNYTTQTPSQLTAEGGSQVSPDSSQSQASGYAYTAASASASSYASESQNAPAQESHIVTVPLNTSQGSNNEVGLKQIPYTGVDQDPLYLVILLSVTFRPHILLRICCAGLDGSLRL